MKPNLIIIQNKPTQFDAPLYAYLHGKHDIKLQIYYTDTSDKKNSDFDPEIGRSPQWDHLNSCEYIRRDLTNFKTNNLIAVANDIASQKPNLVILLGYFPFLHLKLAFFLKTKGIRIGLRSDNTIPHSNFKGIKGVIKRLFLPFCLKQYDTWHPVGTLARQYFEKMSKNKRPTFLFPYNVDNDWFEAESARHRLCRDSIRSKMGFSAVDFIVLGILKWHEREDPMTLIDSFAKLKNQYPNSGLILVGDGPLYDEVYRKANLIGNSVFLPGYAPYSELPKYYAICDVLVHPAINEPWGVSVNEAMACGVPVIASKGVGAGKDLIIEWKTGAIFSNRDINSLTEKLLQIVNSRGLLLKMGTSAKERISQWNYEQTYQELLMAIKKAQMPELTLSIVIPTYQREKVLINTLEYLLSHAITTNGFLELILVDQTSHHEPETEKRLLEWKDTGAIKWLRLDQPHLTRSMNLGLLKAKGDIVLFTDDDIIPNGNLIEKHLFAHKTKPNVWAIAGQVLQPGQSPEPIRYISKGCHQLNRYLNFPFRSTEGVYVENAMAGNLSVKRNQALSIGGFDENFKPPVASRFETEFAKRLVASGGKIWFEPKASIYHLQAGSGGTRSKGKHLNSISPRYGVGDYYYALLRGNGSKRLWYIFKRPFREIRTKYHLKHPWWIPVKFIGEILAIAQAIYLYHFSPKLIKMSDYK